MSRRLLAVCMALVMLVAACSDDSTESSIPTEPSTVATVAEDRSESETANQNEAVDIPTTDIDLLLGQSKDEEGQPSSDTTGPRGANAAPTAQTINPLYLDLSDNAKALYWAWWTFEIQELEDFNIPYETVLENGTIVCASRYNGATNTQIQNLFENEYGYNRTTAVNFIAAALRSICTGYNTPGTSSTEMNIGGYKTAFDRNLNRAYSEISSQINFNSGYKPNIFEYGNFTRSTCLNLTAWGNSTGLIEALVGTYPQYDGWNLRAFEILVVSGVRNVCPGNEFNLGAGWFS